MMMTTAHQKPNSLGEKAADLPKDETKRLLHQHPVLGKRPADGDEASPHMKKTKLAALEEALDDDDDDNEDSDTNGVEGAEGEENSYGNEGQFSGSTTLGYSSKTNISFESLRGAVSDKTLDVIAKMGFKNMTEIQSKSIPALLEGKDLHGTAKTGAGKTLSFVIPLVELLSAKQFKPTDGTAAIIISPTRELSMQTYSVLGELMQERSQTIGIVMGGTNRNVEAEKLGRGVNALVATPGRLLDHMQYTPNFVYNNLVCLVIDEADRLFDKGFEREMKQIIGLLPKHRQTMLFSATKDDETNALARLVLKNNPLKVDVDYNKNQATVEGLEQAYLVCPSDKRFLVLYAFLKKNRNKKVMVFFSSCMAVKYYYELLNYMDIPVLFIHGRQNQNKRTKNFNSFCNTESGILLCTDIAARGWNVPDVDLIVQYDPPDDPSEYIHRVGRTARAGGKGSALLFLREEEIGFITYLKAHKVDVDRMEIPWGEVVDIQPQLEKLLRENPPLKGSAKKGFKGCVSSYISHKLREFFNIKRLDLQKTAKCFGFEAPPIVNFKGLSGKKNRKKGKKYY